MASRSRSRSPLQHEPHPGSGRASPTPSNASAASTCNLSTKTFQKTTKQGNYLLKVANIPLYWKWHQVSTYIKKYTNILDMAIAEDISYIHLKPNPHAGDQEAVVVFNNEHRRHQAFLQLKQTCDKIDGKKLFVTKINSEGRIFNPDVKPPKNFNSQMKYSQNQNHTNPFNSAFKPVNTETYGLSIGYLKELEISPPLTRKVFVRWLPEQYADEDKIRSLFSHAGTVVSASVLTKPTHTNARIEYDHPVEAVQAVSMFNNQEIFGKPIKCEMDIIKKVWTDGMPVKGPGLGPNGTPMRGVRVAVEMKRTKCEIMNEFQKLSESVEELKAQVSNLMHNASSNKAMANAALNAPNPLQNVANPIAANPLATLGNLITNQLQPIQLLQSLMQQNAGNDLGVLGNAIQGLTGVNLSNILQQAQNMGNSNQGLMQGGSNMQSGLSKGLVSKPFNNMQSGPNDMVDIQGGSNNMQGGPNNMQGGSNNMQGGPNNMQGGSNNMQGGPNNMQGGSNNMQGGSNNMQGGPNNMQGGPFNMQSGNSNNMQSALNSAQSGPNMLSSYFNVQSGPSNESNMQTRTHNMQFGQQNMQHSNDLAFGSNNNTFATAKQGSSNMQTGFSYSMQSRPDTNQQINTGFGGQQFNNNNMGRQETPRMGGTTMLLFKNLPLTVTLTALQTKMREVGEVKFVQITGPGRALINFNTDNDAEKCIRLFHQSKVDGQTIEVRKI